MSQLKGEAAACWQLAVRRLQQAHSPWRLWARSSSPYLWVRRVEAGLAVERFSLAPLRRDQPRDIEAAAELCLASAKGRGQRWVGPKAPARQPAAAAASWPELAALVSERVIEAIPKAGSRTHLLGDLQRRIALLPGEPSAAALEAWAIERDPLTERRSFTRRLEVLSWIDRTLPELGVGEALVRLRARRPKGAAVRLAQAQGQRVRLVPEDEVIEAWLDQLQGLDQWVFAVLAIYGLRPHELWHAEPPDAQGWVTIPGEMRTKTARPHSAPPVPARWLQRYRLLEQWPSRRQELLQRWPIRWEERSGVAIPVNNAALGQYLRKQFTLRGVTPLVAPLEGGGSDWLRPYDLRHCYAIRCATSAETAAADPEVQASWLGHSWAVHQRIYLRWLPQSRQRKAQQRQLEQATPEAGLAAAERQELEQLRQQMAALQQLLGQ